MRLGWFMPAVIVLLVAMVGTVVFVVREVGRLTAPQPTTVAAVTYPRPESSPPPPPPAVARLEPPQTIEAPKEAPPSQTAPSQPVAANTDRAAAPSASEALRRKPPAVQSTPPQPLSVLDAAPKLPQVSPPSPVPIPTPPPVPPSSQVALSPPNAPKPPPANATPPLRPELKGEGDRLLNLTQNVFDNVLAQRDASISDYDSKVLHRSKLEKNCDPIHTHLLAFSTNPPPISPAPEFFNKDQMAALSSVANNLEEPVLIGDLLIACSRHFARSNWKGAAIITARAAMQIAKTEKFDSGENREWAIIQATNYCIAEGFTNFSRRERELRNFDRYAIRAAATIVNDVERRVRTQANRVSSGHPLVQAAFKEIENVNLVCSDYFSTSIVQFDDQKDAAPLFRSPILDKMGLELRKYNESVLENKDQMLIGDIEDFKLKKFPKCQSKLDEFANISRNNADQILRNNIINTLSASSWLACSAYYWLTADRFKSILLARFAEYRAASDTFSQLMTSKSPQAALIHLYAVRRILVRTRITCLNYQYYGSYRPSAKLPVAMIETLELLGKELDISGYETTLSEIIENKYFIDFKTDAKELYDILKIADNYEKTPSLKLCPSFPTSAQSSP